MSKISLVKMSGQMRDKENYNRYHREYQRKLLSDPEVRHKKNRRRICRNKGITVEKYDEILAEQDNRCAICLMHLSEATLTGKHFCIDHHHESNTVRGLLCTPCNAAIGMLREDEEIMNRAIEYLRKHNV